MVCVCVADSPSRLSKSPLAFVCMSLIATTHTHAHTHTHTHTQVHSCTHTRAHTHTPLRIHTHTHMHTHNFPFLAINVCAHTHSHALIALDALVMNMTAPTPGLSPSVHPATFSYPSPMHTTHTPHPPHNPAYSPALSLSRRGSMKSITSPPVDGPPHSLQKQYLATLSNTSLTNAHGGYAGGGHSKSEHPSEVSLISERGTRYR